jgi:hypothetical protein
LIAMREEAMKYGGTQKHEQEQQFRIILEISLKEQ